MPPDAFAEQDLRSRGARRIAGVDEVGRGPLAGPVMAAAVVLDPMRVPQGLDDSKKLSAARRAELDVEIRAVAEVSVGMATVAEIDDINILQAAHLAMRRALAGLGAPVCHALVDGDRLPRGLACPATALVGGDARSVSIAAASIVAKVARDAIMAGLAQEHPGYGWETNAGYATRQHRDALQTQGPTPHHRRSFRTVYQML